MTLYELNERFIELKLVEETDLKRSKADPSCSAHKNIYGQWLIVNGNYLMSEAKLSDQNCKLQRDIPP